MIEIFGISTQALFGQLLIGAINGAFYAILSLGIAIIFGLLNIVNFAHGAMYMMGAYVAWMLLEYAGVPFWGALFIAPLVVGLCGMILERAFIRRLRNEDHLYSLLLTFGLGLMITALFRIEFGGSGLPYSIPSQLAGGTSLGFMFLPNYRGFVVLAAIVLCVSTWFIIERTRLGSYLRAATEDAEMVEAFGINVPLMITLTYGVGVALAGIAGVLAAPIYSVNPTMGNDLMIVVFALVVIGGMGSILGAIITGFAVGIAEGLTKVFYPEASTSVVFVLMAVVLLFKPAGFFGKGN